MHIIKEIIENSIAVKQAILLNDTLLIDVEKAVSAISLAFENGKKVLFCGNGGSAADAQHLAAEFSGRFYKDRRALPSEALHCNTSYLTAVANDYSFDVIYSRMIEGIGEEGDVLVGLSTSGNSANIVKAFETARNKWHDHHRFYRYYRRHNEGVQRHTDKCSVNRYTAHTGKPHYAGAYHLPVGRRKFISA